jgi:acetyltransferase-like isoleucine patch superfamily enzyme
MLVNRIYFKGNFLITRIVNQLILLWHNLRPGVNIQNDTLIINSKIKIKAGGKVIIGKNVKIEDTIIDASNSEVIIGDDCQIVGSKIQIKFGGKVKVENSSELLEGSILQTYGGVIRIGENCSVNPYTIIYGHGNTIIGNEVLIAGHCMLIPSNHKISNLNESIREQGNISKGILIEDNVWIGHGCSILDDVIIAEGSVIAAGSVVMKNTIRNGIYAGVPAILKKSRIQ